jgi:hypothetical protein
MTGSKPWKASLAIWPMALLTLWISTAELMASTVMFRSTNRLPGRMDKDWGGVVEPASFLAAEFHILGKSSRTFFMDFRDKNQNMPV